MTLDRLNQHFVLRQRLIKEEAILQTIRDKAQPGAQALTGMPRPSGVHDKVADLVEQIVFLEGCIAPLRKTVEEDAKEIEEFIGSLEDHVAGVCFSLRYFHCLGWKEVADIIGNYQTENSVKKLCYSYLE